MTFFISIKLTYVSKIYSVLKRVTAFLPIVLHIKNIQGVKKVYKLYGYSTDLDEKNIQSAKKKDCSLLAYSTHMSIIYRVLEEGYRCYGCSSHLHVQNIQSV